MSSSPLPSSPPYSLHSFPSSPPPSSPPPLEQDLDQPVYLGSRKRKFSVAEIPTLSPNTRQVRLRPSAKPHRLSEAWVLSSAADASKLWVLSPSARGVEGQTFRRYYDHTRSDRLIILEIWRLIEKPCEENFQGMIHLSGLVDPVGYTIIGGHEGSFDGRRSRVLECGACGTPICDDHALFQVVYPGRILALLYEFLYNQRRAMTCPRLYYKGELGDHHEFFDVVPLKARYVVALLTHWATRKPYDTKGQLKEEWRVKIRQLRTKASAKRRSLDAGEILLYREDEEMFISFFMDGDGDHGALDDSKLQLTLRERDK